jgi:hypothetical protein
MGNKVSVDLIIISEVAQVCLVRHAGRPRGEKI